MIEKIILAGGCFWCTEVVFQQLKGVISVRSGYTGGSIKNPSYREISSGTTGHAEAVEIEFDNSIINLNKILEVFWTTHDPTTLNRQGADKGTQYRSAIFYFNEEQKETSLNSKNNFAHAIWSDPIVTEITEASMFYPAESYHQNYYNNNSSQMYCQLVINPKLSKLRKMHQELLKPIQ